MTAYIVRRLLLMIPTLFGIMLINFAVIQAAPGGPVEQLIARLTGTEVAATARIAGSAGGGEQVNAKAGASPAPSALTSKYGAPRAWILSSSPSWSACSGSINRPTSGLF